MKEERMGMFRSSCCSGQGTHAASSQPACRVRNGSCFTRILLLDTMVMVSIVVFLAGASLLLVGWLIILVRIIRTVAPKRQLLSI